MHQSSGEECSSSLHCKHALLRKAGHLYPGMRSCPDTCLLFIRCMGRLHAGGLKQSAAEPCRMLQ